MTADSSSSVGLQVAFGLLDILVSKLSTFSDTLLPLRTEMLQSVYPLEMLKQTALTWNTYDASGGTPARKLTTQETLEELFKCRTYFDLLAETKEQLRQARDALEAAVDAKDKEWRAIAHHRRVEAEKRSKLMARVGARCHLAAARAGRDTARTVETCG